ncbi:MAG: hypothetical protein UR26_C0006G0028 [candidate division TM6 bacterium GW2011_GWF2_32_72]|nr:MAG: hypothetical protein UR26_C0006G0028 [candidate division TM6 bacterium GW2011_GWF2_32_72]
MKNKVLFFSLALITFLIQADLDSLNKETMGFIKDSKEYYSKLMNKNLEAQNYPAVINILNTMYPLGGAKPQLVVYLSGKKIFFEDNKWVSKN